MKFHFGHGITIVLISFALMLGWFLYRAIGISEALVTENYYEKELHFQHDIDMLKSTATDGDLVHMEASDQTVRITFPPKLKGKKISGVLQLMRPNDARGDRKIDVATDSTGACVLNNADLVRGMYRARLDWHVDGEDRLSEQQLVVP